MDYACYTKLSSTYGHGASKTGPSAYTCTHAHVHAHADTHTQTHTIHTNSMTKKTSLREGYSLICNT